MFTDGMKRRDFLRWTGISALTLTSGLLGYRRFYNSQKYNFTGKIVGANSKVGHMLRTGVTARATKTITIDTVIVGGGIAGLSSGWWFNKYNFKDFVILEMDEEVGGNSIYGENSISKYPWGAHYVPLPSSEAIYVNEFFEDIGIIKGHQNGLPIYDEYFLCSDHHERLFFQGEWQDGLIPQHGVQNEDKKQYEEFFTFIETLKKKRGSDGKFPFLIPMELSSQDPEYLELDKISMSDFMIQNKWNSKYLNWYVNYCCRDDYGMPHNKVSAWAGLHYFVSRSGVAHNADSQSVLTWPEGNGFLVAKLKELISGNIQKNSLVFSIETSKSQNMVDVLDTQNNTCTRYLAKNVIFCGPRFIAGKVIKGYSNDVELDYAPWLVANISLKDKPISHGMQMSWDNVSYYSKSLGYIVANHQDLKINRKETVITYYLPLDEKSPKEERMSAYRRSYHDWLNIIVPDLEKMHPDISQLITNIDIWVWGHGMISPSINYLWSNKRQQLLKPFGSIEFAHSDMSGISVFEEAQFRGVEAAKRILAKNRT
jgi:hypothetical protein